MKKKNLLIPALILVLYVITHLLNLTGLPVFADEAIYIRWAQLIIDDPGRYAFFPLNDGKTPLLMWLFVPFQFLFSDQLFAARFVSVIIGFFQVIAIGYLTKTLGGRNKTSWLAMLLTTLLPFWFFHHRMALTDTLLTLWLTLTTIGVIKIVQQKSSSISKITSKSLVHYIKKMSKAGWFWIIFTGSSLGLAFWSKLPAVLILPALPFYIFLPTKKSWIERIMFLLLIGSACVLGVALFLLLKLHPAFGQLFSRGGDFLYPLSEILQGRWQTTISNFPTYIWYFISYLTAPIVLLMLYAPFSPQFKRQQLLLLLSTAAIAGPIMLMGIVVYPRYLFPASIFLIVSAALAYQEIIDTWITKAKKTWIKVIIGLVIVLLAANTISQSVLLITQALIDPDATPFVSADQVQYLYEWSSGHGIKQTVDLIKNASQDKTIAVATEGYFGTLPDGILLYLHRQNVDNIYVEGVGQPVLEIPESFKERAQVYDQVWLVVNSHRMLISLPEEQHIAQYCRPGTAPCLDVWDISSLIQ